MAISSTAFVQQRQALLAQTTDPELKKHYQAEIDLVKSWDSGDIKDPDDIPGVELHTDITDEQTTTHQPPPIDWDTGMNGSDQSFAGIPEVSKTETNPSGNAPPDTSFSTVPNGYAKDWHTVRFSNTTDEPITVQLTMASGQKLPNGADPNGQFTIPPGGFKDITFDPGTSFNFKSTKGDGSVWNQGELYFDEANRVVWGNMSYIYGANSNMRIFSEDGQHSGYLGDILYKAPPGAKVGDWGIVAPYDRFDPSDDPNDPDSAAGGPDGPKNAGSAYLYSILDKGEGYVGRGRPVEVTDYDDASSLRFTGNMAVVF